MTVQTAAGKHPYPRLRSVLCVLIAIACLPAWTSASAAPANFTRGSETAKQFGVHEIVLTGNGSVANPFDTDVTVTFTPPSGSSGEMAVKAFFDGGDTWRARLYVSESGQWTWASQSADDEKLHGVRGSFGAVPSNLRGKIRAHPKNNRWWATDDGRTFLNLADTAYILFRSPNDPIQPVREETFRLYVKANVRLGITSMRAGGCGGYAGWSRFVRGVMPSYNRSNWCWQEDYTTSGSNRYWERFDLDRFQTTDRRLQWLLDNYPDMYIQLIMGSKVGSRWFRIPLPYRRRTVAYMIARWSAWPQVFYQIVNDTQYTGPKGKVNQAMVREIGGFVAEIEPFGTLRSAGAKRNADNPFTLLADWTWHTYFHTQETTEIDAHVCDYYYQDVHVPVHIYHGEDIYEQDNRSVEATLADPRYYFRRLFWSVLLSGGSPTYGGRYAVLHPYDATAGREWRIQREKLVFSEPLVGLDDIVHVKDYFTLRSIDLGLFTPDDGAAVATPTPKPERNGPSRAQCARRHFEEYLVYLPCAQDGERGGNREGGSGPQKSRGACRVDPKKTPGVRLDLRNATGTYQVEWYRVDDRTSRRGAPIEGGGFRLVTSPWQGADVVVRLLKDKPRDYVSTDIVALKGGRVEYPESTLYAYERNLRAGLSLDMDIRKTADGEIVVMHDETTGRTCDKDWRVAEKTVAQLKTLDAAAHFDPGHDRSYPMRGRGITLPTLDEALALFVQKKQPGAIVWIDTKDDEDYPFQKNQALYDRLVELITEYNLWSEAHVEVSSPQEAKAVKQRDARVRVVFWARNAEAVRNALRCPHYVRIGVHPNVASVMHQGIRDAGKQLYVTITQPPNATIMEVIERVRPDSLGAYYVNELMESLGGPGPPN